MSENRIEKIKALLQEDPEDAFLHHALGMEYLSLGKNEPAMSCFVRAMNCDPGYGASAYQLALLHLDSGDRNAAMQCIEAGIAYAEIHNDKLMLRELRKLYLQNED